MVDLAHAAQQWVQDVVAHGPQLPNLVPPAFAADLAHAAGQHAQQHEHGNIAELAKQLADSVAAHLPQLPQLPELVPPAFAADEIELDPNTKYLYGTDGAVLIDPMNNKPITDDWWNSFIGFQADIIKAIDLKLRAAGVEQAFGWTIVLYTLLIKVLFYPLQQSQLRSTSMMQLLQPKMKEITEKYKDDPETQNRLLGQLYQMMDVNPLGGCLPTLIQLPLFWSLYGVWRRLPAEKWPFYGESWLWVPSLAQPNPDFQFKYDWLLEWENGAPKMGWNDYLGYLVFPALLIGVTLLSQQQASATRNNASGDEASNLVLKFLPVLSVYFIGTLSLQLPQAVSVYYAMNTFLTYAQTAVVKFGLRNEIPGYEEFEKTGKFPASAFEKMLKSATPKPKTLHEAALQGDLENVALLIDEENAKEGKTFDINAWDEKNIAPLGYAVACGHLKAAEILVEKGASLTVLDGQDNTLLHYAAGYGHLEVVQWLLGNLPDEFAEGKQWSIKKNQKGQTVLDAAAVNRKGKIVDFLRKELGIEAPPAEAEVVGLPASAEAISSEDDSAKKARAAMLAAVSAGGGGAKVAEAVPVAAEAQPAADPNAFSKLGEMAAAGGQGQAGGPASAAKLQEAMTMLEKNPEALKKAKEMMTKMPPELLSMMSGNKMSSDDARKAMDNLKNMSEEDLMKRANMAASMMSASGSPTPPPAEGTSQEKGAERKAPARAVD